MALRETLQFVGSSYAAAAREALTGHPLQPPFGVYYPERLRVMAQRRRRA